MASPPEASEFGDSNDTDISLPPQPPPPPPAANDDDNSPSPSLYPSPPPPPSSSSPPLQSPSPPPEDEANTSPPPPPEVSSPPLPPLATSPPLPVATPPPPPAIPFGPPPPPSAFSLQPHVALLPPQPASGNRVTGGSQPPPSTPSPDAALIVGIVVGGVAVLALFIICLMCSTKKKKHPYYMDPAHIPPRGDNELFRVSSEKLPPPPGFMSSDFSSLEYSIPLAAAAGAGGVLSPQTSSMSQFTYEELAAATDGFCEANLIGQGGFGYVHKGILPDNRVVAIKSLKTGSGQGEREFQAEVEIITRVHHRHLVSLVGYCIANHQRLLVYEYVPNKTLEFHLHGKGQPVMNWSTRLKIAVGSAKGLAYLHEDCHPRIIHRDIKSANILLDYNFDAMVADFGLAKLTSDNYTHISTRVMGTFGYLAPEYASSGKLTEKSDVFSFGVMLLELITGRRPVDPTNRTMEDSLVDWARPLLSKAMEDGLFNDLADPRLEGDYIVHEMARIVACAAASIRHSARQRPKMSQIAHALEGESSLNEGIKPTHMNGFEGGYDTMAYNADMMKFRKMVISSQEFNNSEYGNTSEYPSSSSGPNNSREISAQTNC